MTKQKPKICFVVSSPMTLVAFLSAHLRECSKYYDVYIVANSINSSFLDDLGLNVSFQYVKIERKINPFSDLFALINLVRFFNKESFDIVQSVTPKAGLLAMLGAAISRVPIRIHIFTGQIWATKKGLMRFILKSMDLLIARCATNILVDSLSQKSFLFKENVITLDKTEVLGNGSISGVDTNKFKPDYVIKKNIRTEYKIPQHDLVLLYLGRLNRDKGIIDLVNAFIQLSKNKPQIWLFLVGPDEENIELEIQKINILNSAKIVRIGFTKNPEQFLASADIFCLPSYREGFGTSVIEAAACGVPSVASRIYGLTDAVEDGVTGLLHPAGKVEDIVAAINILVMDETLRHKMGNDARSRIESKFTQEISTQALIRFYKQVLDKEK
jgi:glycosyltransferase involved in cell wall biosynthesis